MPRFKLKQAPKKPPSIASPRRAREIGNAVLHLGPEANGQKVLSGIKRMASRMHMPLKRGKVLDGIRLILVEAPKPVIDALKSDGRSITSVHPGANVEMCIALDDTVGSLPAEPAEVYEFVTHKSHT